MKKGNRLTRYSIFALPKKLYKLFSNKQCKPTAIIVTQNRLDIYPFSFKNVRFMLHFLLNINTELHNKDAYEYMVFRAPHDQSYHN